MNGAVRCVSQSPFPGTASCARNTTTSLRAASMARFQVLGPGGSAISTKRASGNWLTMWRVPSVDPSSAQTISSSAWPWPMIRCKMVPKARPAFRVGMTIEIDSAGSPITRCNGRSGPFQPPALGEPHTDEVVTRGCRAITWADPEDLELPFLSRHGAGEADADIEVPEVGFDGRRGRGCSAQLGAAGIEDYGNHRALVDAGRPRHVYWRAYGGTPVRAVDDDLEVVPDGGGRGGGKRRAGR